MRTYTHVITEMLSQTPYAGESYVSGGLKARGSFCSKIPNKRNSKSH